MAKADRKARDVARRQAKLAARVAAMTEQERERYLRLSKAMRPGTPAERERRRQDRAARDEFARLASQVPEPARPEIEALDRQIADLEASIAASKQRTE